MKGIRYEKHNQTDHDRALGANLETQAGNLANRPMWGWRRGAGHDRTCRTRNTHRHGRVHCVRLMRTVPDVRGHPGTTGIYRARRTGEAILSILIEPLCTGVAYLVVICGPPAALMMADQIRERRKHGRNV